MRAYLAVLFRARYERWVGFAARRRVLVRVARAAVRPRRPDTVTDAIARVALATVLTYCASWLAVTDLLSLTEQSCVRSANHRFETP